VNPDLHGALLTVGNNLQPAGHWLAGNWDWLAITVAATFATWAIWKSLPHGDDYRTRNDRVAAGRITRSGPRPEPGEPGRDAGLYLDCVAIYGDCEGLDRLRDAIDQHRKDTT
jgi:hypothetical protein